MSVLKRLEVGVRLSQVLGSRVSVQQHVTGTPAPPAPNLPSASGPKMTSGKQRLRERRLCLSGRASGGEPTVLPYVLFLTSCC